MKKTLIAVVGPTAIGKTSWSIQLAKHYNSEIISTDSRQFYREMYIGTAVPTENELNSVPHHFVQHLSIFQPWSVGDFEREALKLLDTLFANNDMILATGGSGLYLKALCEGLDAFPVIQSGIRESLNKRYEEGGIELLQKELQQGDPEYYQLVDLQNPHRLIRALEVLYSSGKPFSSFLQQPKKERSFRTIYIGLKAERAELYKRIELRVDQMIEKGLVSEADRLLDYRDLSALQTVGYQELFQYLDGKWDLPTAIEEIKKNTRRYAKRQMTWFRKIKDIVWIEFDEDLGRVLKKIDGLLM